MRSEMHGSIVSIRRLEMHHADEMLALRRTNQAFLRPFEPRSREAPPSVDDQRQEIAAGLREWRDDRKYVFGVFAGDTLVGRIALGEVARGAWQNATIGYFIGELYNGRGYATEATKLAVTFAFEEAGLHRVQAGVMPRNVRSIRVMEKAGFRYEGLSERYLEIAGTWEDHAMFAVTVEEWPPL